MKIGIIGKSRYIDADALIAEIERCSYETWSKDVNNVWWAQAVKVKDNIKECIKRQPTADVVEARHGHWVHNEDHNAYESPYFCSECLADGSYDISNEKYCYNCGAKMDGERREE